MNSTGIIIILIVIIICILVALYINMYNKLTFSNIKINETEAQIDSKLRKKYDLINKSIAIIKNNIEEENKVFEEIIKLRSRKISNFDLDRKLAEATTEFFTIKEKHKDLQNNEEIKKIGTEFEEIDIELENLRKYYNENITIYNKLIKTFPTNIVATIGKYKEKLFYDRKDMSDDDYNDFKL